MGLSSLCVVSGPAVSPSVVILLPQIALFLFFFSFFLSLAQRQKRKRKDSGGDDRTKCLAIVAHSAASEAPH